MCVAVRLSLVFFLFLLHSCELGAKKAKLGPASKSTQFYSLRLAHLSSNSTESVLIFLTEYLLSLSYTSLWLLTLLLCSYGTPHQIALLSKMTLSAWWYLGMSLKVSVRYDWLTPGGFPLVEWKAGIALFTAFSGLRIGKAKHLHL